MPLDATPTMHNDFFPLHSLLTDWINKWDNAKLTQWNVWNSGELHQHRGVPTRWMERNLWWKFHSARRTSHLSAAWFLCYGYVCMWCRELIMKILCVTAGATFGVVDQTVGTHPSTFSLNCSGQEQTISLCDKSHVLRENSVTLILKKYL